MKIITTVLLLIFTCISTCNAQNTQSFYQFQLIDQSSQEPVPYAHISNKNRLIAISDYTGHFSIQSQQKLDSISISSIGYLKKTIAIKPFTANSNKITIELAQSKNELSEVIITPNSIKDIIAEIYREIPNKYYLKSHKLIGNYQEFYKDASNNIIAHMSSKLEIYKQSYFSKNKQGEVAINEFKRYVKDSSFFEHIIVAGPHIPHRFDFVMKREEFINPNKNSGYEYTYLKEIYYNNRKIDVISFQPKKNGLLGESYYGKLYIDPIEKVFIKAEYNYTSLGLIKNFSQRWAKQRKFITEYKQQNGKWYLNYTWDEAVSKTKQFKLTQEFYTKKLISDTILSLKAIEKINFNDAFLLKEDTSSINNNISKKEIVAELLKQNKKLRTLSKLEASFGLKFLQIQNREFTISNNINFDGNPISNSANFEVFSLEPAFSNGFSYQLKKNWLINFNASPSLRKNWKIESYEFGLSKRFKFNINSPLSLNMGLSYQNTKQIFNFSKVNGFTPKYEKRYNGVNGSLRIEIELNSRKQFYIGYSYAHQLSDKDKFFLERKHGFLNLKKDKRNYNLNDINLQVDGQSVSTFPNVIINSSIDFGLILSFGL